MNIPIWAGIVDGAKMFLLFCVLAVAQAVADIKC